MWSGDQVWGIGLPEENDPLLISGHKQSRVLIKASFHNVIMNIYKMKQIVSSEF